MRAADRAYALLRQRIVDGTYVPSQRIPEAEVAEAAGVGRPPVREALRRLEAEGWLRIVLDQGAFVSRFAEAEAEELFELRRMLEGWGVTLAVERATDEEIARLRDLAGAQHEEARRRPEGHLARIRDLDTRFHRLLHESARSARLLDGLDALGDAPLVMQTFRGYDPIALRRSAHHHIELADALEARDPEWARRVVEAHILAARAAFRRGRGEATG
jgi:DNA-binding GntR family transcriptional regulator